VPDYYWVSYRERAVSGRVKRIILSLRLVGCDDRESTGEELVSGGEQDREVIMYVLSILEAIKENEREGE
jgi:hypothetical protein